MEGSLHCGGLLSPSVEMTIFVWVWGRTGNGMNRQRQRAKATAKGKSNGNSRSLRDDNQKNNGQLQYKGGNGETKAKCGGLSAPAAKAPPSVEMTIFCVGVGENRQQQERARARTKRNVEVSQLRRRNDAVLGQDDDCLGCAPRTSNGDSGARFSTGYVMLDGVFEKLRVGLDSQCLHHPVLLEGDCSRFDIQDTRPLSFHRHAFGQLAEAPRFACW